MQLRVRSSVRHARLPLPGLRGEPWTREDVVKGGPSPRSARFVARHDVEEAPEADARVGYATVVAFAMDGALEVEERICVEPRVLAPFLRAERAISRRLDKGGAVGERIIAGGSRVVSRAVPGKGGAAVATTGGFVARAPRWVLRQVVEGLRAIISAPDSFASGASLAGAQLSRRRERRAFLRGFVNPYSLTREGKAAALFVVIAALLLAVVVGTLGVVFFAPEQASLWRHVVLLFGLGLGSTLVFPFFPEFAIADAANALAVNGSVYTGAAIAILLLATSMTVGGWMVLFLGEAIHGALRAAAKPRSWLARGLDGAERFARKRGFWAAFLVLAIPLGPDTPVFYVLATVRTPPHLYLAGAFAGLMVRFSLFYFVPVIYYDVLLTGYYL